MNPQDPFAPGSRVVHARFGAGVVKSVRGTGQRVVVFDTEGTRWIHPDHLMDPAEVPEVTAAQAQWPIGTFVAQPPEAEHFLGSHWRPFGLDAAAMLSRLPEIAPQAQLQEGWGSRRGPPPHIEPLEWPRGFQLAWPSVQQGLGLVIQRTPDQPRMVSLFPFSASGTQLSLELAEVKVWDSGLEAQISARWGDASITFFDTRHLVDRAWYVAGQSYDFIVAGLAYDVGPAQAMSVPFEWQPELVERLRALSVDPKSLPEPGPSTLSLEGSTVFLPIDGWDEDDYQFRGPITQVRAFTDWLGQDGWTARTTVLRAGPAGADQDLDIHITRQAWAGENPPEVGQDIEGRLWLQGYLWMPL